MLSFSTKPNLIGITLHLLKVLKVRVTTSTVKEKLETHPHYPSLLAISDSLNDWGVENQSYHLDKNDFDSEELHFPLIAHFPENDGRFILVEEIDGKNVKGMDEKGKIEIRLGEFLKRWSGIVLHATATENSGETSYQSNVIKALLRLLIAPTAFILICGMIYLALTKQTITFWLLSSALFKLIGVGTSVLLLMQSLNVNNPFIKNLCGLAGKNDCNAILKSEAAKITLWLSWSEVGFFYFTGSFICLISTYSAMSLLGWLSLLAIPYTIFSLGYQYKVKNWCILCCVVQFILIIEAVNFLSSPFLAFAYPTLHDAVFFAGSFLMPIIVWAFLKPFFVQASQLEPMKNRFRKFKYNTDLFNHALKSQPKYSVGNELMPITLGDPGAETTITMVSNPFCGPCAKAHETLNDWIKKNNDVQLKIIFATSNQDEEEHTKVARHLVALSVSKDKQALENALDEWYASLNKNYASWADKHPIATDQDFSKVTQVHKEWCKLAEIAFTPTFLVNGRKLPEPYQLEDIKYLIN